MRAAEKWPTVVKIGILVVSSVLNLQLCCHTAVNSHAICDHTVLLALPSPRVYIVENSSMMLAVRSYFAIGPYSSSVFVCSGL